MQLSHRISHIGVNKYENWQLFTHTHKKRVMSGGNFWYLDFESIFIALLLDFIPPYPLGIMNTKDEHDESYAANCCIFGLNYEVSCYSIWKFFQAGVC